MKRILILSGILFCGLGGIPPVVGGDPPPFVRKERLVPARPETPGQAVFPLQHTKAKVAQSLVAQTFEGVQVWANENTNSLNVVATTNLIEKIDRFLNLLDSREEAAVTEEFRLRHTKAKSLQSLLAQTFKGVKVNVDEKTNSLILIGTANEVKKVRQFLQVLDWQEDVEPLAKPRRMSRNGNAQPAATEPMRGESSDRSLPKPLITAAPPGLNAAPAAGPVAKERNPDEFAPRTAPEYADGLPAQAPATLDKPEARVQDSQSRADDAVRSKDAPVPSNDPVHIARLNHVPAREMRERLKSLFPDAKLRIEADERSNSLLIRGPQEMMRELDRIVQQLDKPRPRTPSHALDTLELDSGPRRPATSGAAAERRKGAKSSTTVDEPKPENIRKLRRAYDECDEKARMTAAKIRVMLKDTGSKPSPDLPVVAWQRAGLRQQVAEAFEGRQQLQRAELDWHRQRLARIEQQIAEREPIKDQVIDRRVDELLNPNLQWDPSKLQAAPAVSGAPAFAGPLTSTEPIDISTKNTNFKPKGTSDPFQAEKEQRTRKNLQQLALAMHNYHDVRFNFPPAVVMSPDGKTPHSWRVELLPFLGETDLYQRYRKDEPWDSPHNEDLFKWLPDVFRSPYDDPHSTNSGYYALVGPGTVFEKGPHGVKISDITDGTSNTLLVVEARRNIPWTKPDDISFDPDKPVPEWGGFVKGKFAAALADGSVHIFDREKVDSILKWMIIRNDMQPITIPIP